MVRRERLVAARPSDRAAGEGPGRAIGAADRPDRCRQDAGRVPAVTHRTGRQAQAQARPGDSAASTRSTSRRLKALAVDIERNLGKPVDEIGLPVTIETRTGDTPSHKRQRQKLVPPDILLTTPEQLALLIAAPDARRFFEDLRYVVLDELHSLVTSKRGHLLALGLARLRSFVPGLQTIGLSATVAEPDELRRWLVSQNPPKARQPDMAELIVVTGGAKPEISILDSRRARAVGRPFGPLRHARNLRGDQARTRRRCSSSTRAARRNCCSRNCGGSMRTLCRSRCITARSTSPSAGGSKRRWARMRCAPSSPPRRSISASTGAMSIWSSMSARRRAPAGWRSASAAPTTAWTSRRKAILIPANRFEVLECRAALDANYLGAQDTPPLVNGALDVLAQHVLGMRLRRALPRRRSLSRRCARPHPMPASTATTFDRVVDFVATGGYALRNYERYARSARTRTGCWRVSQSARRPAIPAECRHHHRGAGAQRALVARPAAGASAGARRPRARQDRGVLSSRRWRIGDTFLFAGKVLRFEGIRENEAVVSQRARQRRQGALSMPAASFRSRPISPSSVRGMLADPRRWKQLPEQVRRLAAVAERRNRCCPKRDDLLVETFPRGNRHYHGRLSLRGQAGAPDARHAADPAARAGGRQAARLRRHRLCAGRLVAGRHGLRCSRPASRRSASCSTQDMLGDDLEAWLADSWLLKRTFRNCALISPG